MFGHFGSEITNGFELFEDNRKIHKSIQLTTMFRSPSTRLTVHGRTRENFIPSNEMYAPISSFAQFGASNPIELSDATFSLPCKLRINYKNCALFLEIASTSFSDVLAPSRISMGNSGSSKIMW